MKHRTISCNISACARAPGCSWMLLVSACAVFRSLADVGTLGFLVSCVRMRACVQAFGTAPGSQLPRARTRMRTRERKPTHAHANAHAHSHAHAHAHAQAHARARTRARTSSHTRTRTRTPTTGAHFKPGAGRRIPGDFFCTNLVLRLYYGSKFQARSRLAEPRAFFVLILYYACSTGANLKPGAGRRSPGDFCCTNVV